jgi:hypothetical protein
MRFKELRVDGKVLTRPTEISAKLRDSDLNWLINSEIEDAVVEIKNNTVIWESGDFISGNWHYGIFKSGNFYGTFENGIFEGGNFEGRFVSGIRK